jgi:hypothetical protein
MRSSGPLACTLLAALVLPAWAEPPEQELAKSHLALMIHSELGDTIARDLAASGLDPAEIDDVAFKAAQGYAACVIDSFVKDDDPRSRLFVSWLAQGKSKDEIDAELKAMSSGPDPLAFMDVLELPVKTCGFTVNQELGLPPEANS